MRKSSTEKAITRSRIGIEDQFNFANDLGKVLDEKDKDIIYGIYGGETHSLGVMNVLYSGLPTLDKCLAIKRNSEVYGTPLNKIIEVFGAEQSGKTTLAEYLMVQIIKNNGLAFFVDFEHKFDPAWLIKIANYNGLTTEELKKRFRYVDPEHFESFVAWLLRFMKRVIEAKNQARKEIIRLKDKKGKEEELEKQYKIINTPFIVVVDSIASIYTKAEKEGEEESDIHVAELARLFNRCLKHIRYYLGYTNSLILFLNQVRDRIETNPWLAKRGSKIKTPGGNAIKHFSDGRIQISRTGVLSRTRNKIKYSVGSTHIVKVVKNQMGPPPFMETELTLLNSSGFFSFKNVLDILVEAGKVKKDGSIYTFTVKGKKISMHESDVDMVYEENKKYGDILHRYYQSYMEGQGGNITDA